MNTKVNIQTTELVDFVRLMQADRFAQCGLLVLENETPLTIEAIRQAVPKSAKVAVINNAYDDDTLAEALTQAAGGWLVLLLNADPSTTTYNQLVQLREYGRLYLSTANGIVTVDIPPTTKILVVMADALLDDISYHAFTDQFDLVLRSQGE